MIHQLPCLLFSMFSNKWLEYSCLKPAFPTTIFIKLVLSVISSYPVYWEPTELYIVHNTGILTTCYRQPISYVREPVCYRQCCTWYTCSQPGVHVLNLHTQAQCKSYYNDPGHILNRFPKLTHHKFGGKRICVQQLSGMWVYVITAVNFATSNTHLSIVQHCYITHTLRMEGTQPDSWSLDRRQHTKVTYIM